MPQQTYEAKAFGELMTWINDTKEGFWIEDPKLMAQIVEFLEGPVWCALREDFADLKAENDRQQSQNARLLNRLEGRRW
jgi:hypothetical protein